MIFFSKWILYLLDYAVHSISAIMGYCS
jgi:hypothetical protein